MTITRKKWIPKRFDVNIIEILCRTFAGLNWSFFETGENRFAHMPHEEFMDLQEIIDDMDSGEECTSPWTISKLFEAER